MAGSVKKSKKHTKISSRKPVKISFKKNSNKGSNKKSNKRSSKSNKVKCAPGEILRKGYTKKNKTYVRPTCVEDTGKPGKGPKTLPSLKGDMHLSDYGYTIRDSDKERQLSLKRAAKDVGTLKTLRHLNLINNVTASTMPGNKQTYEKDIRFLSELYAEQKE